MCELLFSDLPTLFAALIARSAKELELLIDHLPPENNLPQEVILSWTLHLNFIEPFDFDILLVIVSAD